MVRGDAIRSHTAGAAIDWNQLTQKGIGRRIAQRINNSHSF